MTATPAETDGFFNTVERNKIASKLSSLPYSGMLPNTRNVVDVDSLTDWLELLRAELIRASSERETMVAKLSKLENQRDAIRSFLGTTEILEEL